MENLFLCQASFDVLYWREEFWNKKLAPAAWESQHGVSVEEAEEDHDKLLR